MKQIFTKRFWNTPLSEMAEKDKGLAMVLFLAAFILCVAIGGIAAWRIIH